MVSLQAALTAMALSGAGQPVLLDFYADWCNPCKAMEPTVQALIDEGYPVQKINIDQHPQLARQYRVPPVPCYVLVVDGQEVDRVVGGTSFYRLKQMFQRASGRAVPGQSPIQDYVAPAKSTPPKTAAPLPLPPARDNFAHSVRPARQDATPGWSPPGGVPVDPDAQLLAASVRLRVDDSQGQSYGSGTIIDARQGYALILTCAHIFRDSQGKGRVMVDLFGPHPAEQVPGRLISWDLDRDVGLVCIRAPEEVAVARVAPPGYRIAPGMEVVSIGCNNGDRPSAEHSRLTSARYAGPPSFQVAGEPVDGRSGGGIFNRDGMVVGVCNAADRIDKAAFCAALEAIHVELDKVGLSQIYQASPTDVVPAGAIAAADPPSMPKQMPGQMPSPADWSPARDSSPIEVPLRPVSGTVVGAAGLSAAQQAALEEIRRRMLAGDELVIVARRRQDPQARSEVIMVSPESTPPLVAAGPSPGTSDARKELVDLRRERPPAVGQGLP